MNESINQISQQMGQVFLSLGFQKTIINDKINYEYKGSYRRIDYNSSIGLIIEFAETLEEAEKNVYEDDETYPLSLGDELFDFFKKDVIRYMLD